MVVNNTFTPFQISYLSSMRALEDDFDWTWLEMTFLFIRRRTCQLQRHRNILVLSIGRSQPLPGLS